MKVGELIEELKHFDENSKVVITMTCDNDFRQVDEVRFAPIPDLVIIESHEVPDFQDLQVIAKEVMEEHGDNMTRYEQKLMIDFIK
jgi:hypothetical protein